MTLYRLSDGHMADSTRDAVQYVPVHRAFCLMCNEWRDVKEVVA